MNGALGFLSAKLLSLVIRQKVSIFVFILMVFPSINAFPVNTHGVFAIYILRRTSFELDNMLPTSTEVILVFQKGIFLTKHVRELVSTLIFHLSHQDVVVVFFWYFILDWIVSSASRFPVFGHRYEMVEMVVLPAKHKLNHDVQF